MRVVLRRAVIALAALSLLPLASDVWSQSQSHTLSGLGYIDFRGKPRFKVGDWVKYRFTSKSDGGQSEDYTMTILISGEEKFWGDDCFWVETWAGGRSLPPQANAILMSYSAFGDTSWLQHIQVYQRKTASLGEEGVIQQDLVRRVIKGKATGDDRPTLTVKTDTLGTDTVHVALGVYRCQMVGRKAGAGTVEEKGDSTMRFENWDRRTLYLSNKVPMTSLVRELDERWITRKSWKVGKSADAIQAYTMRGTGTLDLVEFGSGNLAPRMTPMYARKNLAKLVNPPAPRRKAPAKTPAKPG